MNEYTEVSGTMTTGAELRELVLMGKWDEALVLAKHLKVVDEMGREGESVARALALLDQEGELDIDGLIDALEQAKEAYKKVKFLMGPSETNGRIEP